MLRSIIAVALLAMNAPPALDNAVPQIPICNPIAHTDEGPTVSIDSPPDTPASYPRTAMYAGMPPPRFRYSSAGMVRVVFGHIGQCGSPDFPGFPNATFASCIRQGGVLYLPNPCDYPQEDFARLACHEQAHFNGWPKEHGA